MIQYLSFDLENDNTTFKLGIFAKGEYTVEKKLRRT